MYPGCRFIDLHPRPQEREDPMSYAPHQGPGFGHITPQMKLDTARSPVIYDSFPCHGTYGCPPHPSPYHGCYHYPIPDYHGYGLHYPHYAPPPPAYCHGSHPSLPGRYPSQYLPSPHYSVVDTPVDHHCCGCPNHLCQQMKNKNIKIEEQTSDDEKDRVASLAPSEHQSYPVLCIPPGYQRNKEGEQTIKPEYMRESSFDKEAKGSLKPSVQEPGIWNGWLPINLNNLNSLVQERDEKGTEHQQNEDSKSLFPVGCMPSNPEQRDKLDLKDGDQKSIWNPSQHQIFPRKFIENQDKKSMPEGDAENYDNSSSEDGRNTGNKNVVKKIIPVKQMDQFEEKVLPRDDQIKENSPSKVGQNHSEMSLKHTDSKREKKDLENNSNVHSSRSKASKLPPVCLRVDPLPSRRTRSGTSRSLSPPADKKKPEMLSHDKSSSSSATMRGNSQQDMQSSAYSDQGRLQSEKKVKSIEVVDGDKDSKTESCKKDLSQPVNASAVNSQENVSSVCQDGKGGKSDQEFSVGDEGMKNVNKLSGEVTKDEEPTTEGKSYDVKCETGANGGPIDIKESELASTNGVPYQKFSKAEAATIIQSAYRGFEVRRWEPLKKLKEIARINGELVKIRLDVQDLVSSGSKNIDRQKIVIGETIMNLLLQLDTMQGLHPSIRNIRKSVAKELVSLQEKLDSITFQSSDELEESVQSKHAEDISKRACEEEREQAGDDRREQDTTPPSHIKSGVMDVNISSVNMETPDLFPERDEMGGVSEEKEPDFSSCVDLNDQHRETLIEVRESNEVHGVREEHDSFLVESLPPSIIAEEELDPKHDPVLQLQNRSSMVDSDWSSKEDEVTKVITEMPPQVPKLNFDAQVSGEGLQIDGGRYLVNPGKLEQDSGLISPRNEAKETGAEEQQHKELLTDSANLSNPNDNIATTGCSEGSSEPKENIGAEGDTERDKELSGDGMLGAEFVEESKEKHVSNIDVEANVFLVEEVDKSIDDMKTAAVEVKEISNMEVEANAGEVAREGDDKPVEDMQTEHNMEDETKEANIGKAVNVGEIEGGDDLVDDMQTETASTVGLEQRKTPEVEEFEKDVGLVEDTESSETCGPGSEDLSMATSELLVKQQKPSVFKDTVSGEEVHMKKIANCNSEQNITVDEDQEMWKDKFDNKEFYPKHSNGNIVDLPVDEDLVEEEFGTEIVDRQPHRKFATGEGDLAGEEHVARQPQKEVPASLRIAGQISSVSETENDKKLVEENEKLKETVEKLIAAGKEQLGAISSLLGRVEDLEKKLTRKKKLKVRRHKSSSEYLV